MHPFRAIAATAALIGALVVARPSYSASVAPICPSGYTYDSGAKHCVSIKQPECAGDGCDERVPSNNLQPSRPELAKPPPSCPMGYFPDDLTHQCISTKEPPCPFGYRFAPASNKCESRPHKPK
jgi:hypothetical protein